jgi:hypothetical protein
MPDMKPKSMKLTEEEAKKQSPWKYEKGKLMKGEVADQYPHGLRVELDTRTLKKLGLKPKDFDIGDERSIAAQIKVTQIRDEQRVLEDPEQSVTLQITMLGIGDSELPLEEMLFKDK